MEMQFGCSESRTLDPSQRQKAWRVSWAFHKWDPEMDASYMVSYLSMDDGCTLKETSKNERIQSVLGKHIEAGFGLQYIPNQIEY